MIEKILEVLNREFKLNRDDCQRIFYTPIPVSENYSEDTAFLSLAKNESGGPGVRGIGMLNGILIKLGIPRVAAQFDGDNNLVGFCEYVPAQPKKKKSKKKK